MDAVDAYRQGVQSGQQVFIEMINQYCNIEVKDLSDLIRHINSMKETHDD